MELTFDGLPDLPQCRSLVRFAPILWQQEGVQAIWIGGSLARNAGDRYSDIDLRIAVIPEALEAWKSPDFDLLFQGACVGRMFVSFGEDAFLHSLVLSDGTMYDLWIQSVERELAHEQALILGCRDESLASQLAARTTHFSEPPQPAEAETIRQLLIEYWITTHKHRKVLDRGLHLLALFGLQIERNILLRLWYILATGQDSGQRSLTIHSLTEFTRTVEQTSGVAALEILGAPATDFEAICRAIERMRDEVSEAGLQLATRMDFDYPHALEETARRGWAEFLHSV